MDVNIQKRSIDSDFLKPDVAEYYFNRFFVVNILII